MRHFRLSLLCPILWLSALASAQAPPESEERVSLNIIQTEPLIFPWSLRDTLVMDGNAKIAINVDQDGRLVDWLITGYSRKEFADAAVEALRHWRFEPPCLNGEPWASVQELHIDYSRTGVVVSVVFAEAMENRFNELTKDKYIYRSFTLRELDRIPIPVQVVPPVAPPLGPNQKERTVKVEFYIDEEGRVRLPSIARADARDMFAASALAAVKQWRFEPPLYKGRPVLVLVKQEFNFVPKHFESGRASPARSSLQGGL